MRKGKLDVTGLDLRVVVEGEFTRERVQAVYDMLNEQIAALGWYGGEQRLEGYVAAFAPKISLRVFYDEAPRLQNNKFGFLSGLNDRVLMLRLTERHGYSKDHQAAIDFRGIRSIEFICQVERKAGKVDDKTGLDLPGAVDRRLEEALAKPGLKNFLFRPSLNGTGETPQEAWANMLEGFAGESGEADPAEIDEITDLETEEVLFSR